MLCQVHTNIALHWQELLYEYTLRKCGHGSETFSNDCSDLLYEFPKSLFRQAVKSLQRGMTSSKDRNTCADGPCPDGPRLWALRLCGHLGWRITHNLCKLWTYWVELIIGGDVTLSCMTKINVFRRLLPYKFVILCVNSSEGSSLDRGLILNEGVNNTRKA
jgi:hypothetical protein